MAQAYPPALQPRESDSLRWLNFNVYQVGTLAAIISICAFFAALVIAFALRVRVQHNWQPIAVPHLLWVSTGVLGLSSVLYESARSALRHGQVGAYQFRVSATLLAGMAFLGIQLRAWLELAQAGVYLQSNPHGSAYYVFSGAHGLHLIGGLAALAILLFRARNLKAHQEQALRRQRAFGAAAALYWHFMGLLWAALFGLLIFWG